VALTAAFGDDPAKQAQWRAFVRKNRIEADTPGLGQIVRAAADFLEPVSEAAASGDMFQGTWRPRGPWKRVGAGR